MLIQFQSNIRNNRLFSKEQRLLLAFSGGVDSVVLADLLHRSGYTFDLAHCNFKLRGTEADEDEGFCKNAAAAMNAGFHSVHFDTKAYSESKKLSIQMAARELRYNWFMELRQTHHYDHILTAHHADDNIETFFVNLTRGSGINGLQGIPPQQGDIVRPLLFAFKEEIMQYAKEHALPFRSDSSNAEVKYKRNFIRHELVPKFKFLNPAFGETLLRDMGYLGESAAIIHDFSALKFREMCTQHDNGISIDLQKITAEPYKKTLLFGWLQPFGFNASQLEQLIEVLDKTKATGKAFLSGSHQLLIDRTSLLVSRRQEKNEPEEFIISNANDTAQLPVNLKIELTGDQQIASSLNVACLDADLIQFPLTLRRWRQGDKFRPVGMTGFKKLSDYFTDVKMSLYDKEQAWILESKGAIIWLVNRRIDDRFKLTEQTKHVIKISYI